MSYKILVVDDEQPVREMFRDLLTRERCTVTCASSGEEAVTKVTSEDFEIILLDIKLGGMSGLETLKKIKEIKPETIVIMVTGFGYDEDLIKRSKELGCSGYIGKNMPISQVMGSFRLFAKTATEKKSQN